MIITELTAAELDAAAYEDPRDFGSVPVLKFFDSVKPIQSSGSESFVAHVDDTSVVSIRGTEAGAQKSWRDWLNDLRFLFPTAWNSGRAHRGFVKGYKAIRTQIITELKSKQPKKIICTGHSYGAAKATLLASELLANGWESKAEIWLLTIGGPRVVTAPESLVMERCLQGRIRRFVMGQDIVTRVPPAWLRIIPGHNYRHTDKADLLHCDGIIYQKQGRQELRELRLESIAKRGLKFGSDHSSKGYVKFMERWLEDREESGMDPLVQIETKAKPEPN